MRMRDVVTEITELRRGVRVTVNRSEVFQLSPAEMRDLPLTVGEALDWEEYRQRLLLRQYPDALNRAVSLLATRARSTAELTRRLAGQGYLPDTVEMVLYKLEKERLTDDAAFAKAWVENRAARGVGKMRLKQELRLKGIQEGETEEALASLDEDTAAAQATALASKLLRRHRAAPAQEKRRKVITAMQRRGYSYGEAARALDAALAVADETLPTADEEDWEGDDA